MKQASLIIGIISIFGMLIGFIPCFGWFNWLNIPLAIIGIIIGALAYGEERDAYQNNYYQKEGPIISKNNGTPTGLILCCIAFVLGSFRLVIGFGVF